MTRTADIERLLDQLCVDLGFCLPAVEKARLSAMPPTDAKAFTNAVFVAEGLDPETADRHLWRQVRDRVTQCFRDMQDNDAV